MKAIAISLCVGVALAGSMGCGNTDKPHSTVQPGGMLIPGAAGGSVVSPSGGANSSLLIPDMNDPPTMGQCTGATCACPSGSTTTISGYVFDPAGKNPLYNISVYVPDPSAPLPNLDSVPLSCGCSQLLPAKVLATGTPTDATGHFVIPCAPSGNVSLVVQTGKWRRRYDGVSIKPNQDNKVPDMRLPANSAEGSLPNIAISTGGADSFECLPLRIGVAASEYVAGSATGGHIHIYTGHNGAALASGAVESPSNLWDTQAHVNEHDVVILACEGNETTFGAGRASGATAQSYLMSYANAGGRVFASHFQYAWFNTGPFATAPNNIATWVTGGQHIDDTSSFPAVVDTTLSSGAAFPEGAALQQWLGLVGALTNNQLPVWYTRNNVQALAQPPSTEWIHLDQSVTQAPLSTQYFSVDTPINAAGGAVCGRVVYSDLHVTGGPGLNAPGIATDYPTANGGATPTPVPGGMGGTGELHGGVVPTECASRPLTPQEEALEFMLFDLSSCLVPIGQTPPTILK